MSAKYSGHVNIGAVESVDFVWRDEPLAKLLGNKLPLDYIVASHVIEHVPDLRGWLHEAWDALGPSGRLLLVVPDKQYTFDINRPLASFDEVKAAYAERRRRPGLRHIADHFANVVQADCYALWDHRQDANGLSYHHGPEFIELAVDEYRSGKYIDVHCWVFTPEHFRLLFERMRSEMDLRFEIAHFLPTPEYDLEFYVQLKKV